MLLGYSGPCSGDGTHRYRFRLYALDRSPAIVPGARKAELTRAMSGHIIEQVLLTGIFGKGRK